MTNTTYNERDRDGTNQVIPDWYRRFFNCVVGFDIADSLILPTDDHTIDESRVALPN
jgi:hypothetical protein